jgi:hypothetical protein
MRNSIGAVARQRSARISGNNVGSGVFHVVRSEAISFDRPSRVSAVQWSELVGEGVRGLPRFSSYEPLLLEAGSRGTETVRELRQRLVKEQ